MTRRTVKKLLATLAKRESEWFTRSCQIDRMFQLMFRDCVMADIAEMNDYCCEYLDLSQELNALKYDANGNAIISRKLKKRIRDFLRKPVPRPGQWN